MAAADHGIGTLKIRVKAIDTVAKGLELMAGLAEADRLGLQVLREVLADALRELEVHAKLSAAQAEHLKGAGKALVDAADAMSHNPTPVEIAAWWRGVEPAAREFVRSVHDLPHR